MALENIAYIALGWIGLGFLIVILGIFLLAKNQEGDFTRGIEENGHTDKMEELFSFFLEEEEKKNAELRKVVSQRNDAQVNIDSKKEMTALKNTQQSPIEVQDGSKESLIFNLYKKGNNVEEIAKQLKMGVGEVNLILSLYSMR